MRKFILMLMGLIAVVSYSALAYENFKLRAEGPRLVTRGVDCGAVLDKTQPEDGTWLLKTSKCGSFRMDLRAYSEVRRGSTMYYIKDLGAVEHAELLCFDMECIPTDEL